MSAAAANTTSAIKIVFFMVASIHYDRSSGLL
jgi:hypothetical protein